MGSDSAMPAFAIIRSSVLDFEVDRHCLKRATWSFHFTMSHLTRFACLKTTLVSFVANNMPTNFSHTLEIRILAACHDLDGDHQ